MSSAFSLLNGNARDHRDVIGFPSLPIFVGVPLLHFPSKWSISFPIQTSDLRLMHDRTGELARKEGFLNVLLYYLRQFSY